MFVDPGGFCPTIERIRAGGDLIVTLGLAGGRETDLDAIRSEGRFKEKVLSLKSFATAGRLGGDTQAVLNSFAYVLRGRSVDAFLAAARYPRRLCDRKLPFLHRAATIRTQAKLLWPAATMMASNSLTRPCPFLCPKIIADAYVFV
jgi:hypothetical protein